MIFIEPITKLFSQLKYSIEVSEPVVVKAKILHRKSRALPLCSSLFHTKQNLYRISLL